MYLRPEVDVAKRAEDALTSTVGDNFLIEFQAQRSQPKYSSFIFLAVDGLAGLWVAGYVQKIHDLKIISC